MRRSLPSSDRILKTVPGGVLASFQGSTYEAEYASPSHSLRPCRTTVLSILYCRRQLNMAPSFVLRSKESSTYRRGYASGSFSPAALLDDRVELPVVVDQSGCS